MIHLESTRFFFFSQIFLAILSFIGSTPVWNDLDSPFLVVRVKRNANRAMTYTGFNGNGGMTAFATSGQLPFYQYGPSVSSNGYSKKSASQQPGSLPASSDESPPVFFSGKEATQQEEGKALSGSSEGSSASEPGTNEYDSNSLQPSVRKSKKKPVSNEDDDDDDEEHTRGRSSSRSSSSFNAWFPIMLGVYPAGSSNGAGGAYKDSEGNGKERAYGTTIIANSVSNGKSGVAHAIAYGGPSGPTPNFGTH